MKRQIMQHNWRISSQMQYAVATNLFKIQLFFITEQLSCVYVDHLSDAIDFSYFSKKKKTITKTN